MFTLVLSLLIPLEAIKLTTAVSVPFPNGGFESFPAGGANDWTWPSRDWAWDGGAAHSGTHSVRVSRNSGAATATLWSPNIAVQPSTVYTLTYWLRTQNATYIPTIEVFQSTTADIRIGPRLLSLMKVGSGYNDWFQVRFRFQTMPNAHHINLNLYLYTATTGTFWFDDFSLDQGAPAAYPFQSGLPVAASVVRLSSPVVADIDNDGDNELLVGDGEARVMGWDHRGVALSNFPLLTGDAYISGQIAMADLDGDRDLEIVAGTRALQVGDPAHVFAWHHTGQLLSGWPKSVDWNSQCGNQVSRVSSVALADIDGNGQLEILAGTTNGAPDCVPPNLPDTPNLYAWYVNGTPVVGNWPTSYLGAAIYGAIAVGDLVGNGVAAVITGRDHHYLYAYSGNGSPLSGWPISTFLNSNDGNRDTDIRISHMNSAPVIADLDGDGINEYIVAGNVKHPGESVIRNSGLLVLEPDGTRRVGWETAVLGAGILADVSLPEEAPAIADLDGEGQLEIVVATYDGWIRAYKPDKSILWAFDYAQGASLFASEPVIGDVDGDKSLEVIFGTFDPAQGDGPVGLWGLDANGTPLPGFPLAVGTPGIRAAPTLADLDSDGDVEILAADWNGVIWAWDTPGPNVPARLPWPTGRHDLRRNATLVRLAPDLRASQKFAIRLTPQQGETTTFIIRLENSGGLPFTHTLRLTDTLSAGVVYVPGSLTATLGTVTDTGNMLRWSGVMSNASVLDVSYAVTITTNAISVISNTVTLDTIVDGLITRTGYIIANGQSVCLPLVCRTR